MQRGVAAGQTFHGWGRRIEQIDPVCLRVTLLLVSVTMGLFGLQMLLDGNMGYLIGSLDKYGGSSTGIYRVEDGFNAALTRITLSRGRYTLVASRSELRSLPF